MPLTPVTTTTGGSPLPMPESPFRHGLDRHGLLDQPVEELAAPLGGAAVEPERELVQIIVQVRRTDRPLMGAQEPAFQQGDHAIGAGQQVLPHHRRLLPHDLMAVASFRQPAVAPQSIRLDEATGFHGLLHGTLQLRGRGIRHATQPNASDARPIGLPRNDPPDLSGGAPAVLASAWPAQEGLVDFHRPSQTFPSRPYHGAAQLMQPPPRP